MDFFRFYVIAISLFSLGMPLATANILHASAFYELTSSNAPSDGTCRIWDLEVKHTDCRDDGTFNALISFKHMDTGDFFTVVGNGHKYGSFHYSDPQPYIIEGLKGDCTTPYEFVVLDKGNDDCIADIELGPVCCDSSGACRIWDLEVKHTDCRDDGTFNALISFKHKNTGDFFTVVGNGHKYGSFHYSDPQPYIIEGLKGDCTTPYEFVVLDKGNDDCIADIELGPVCCEEQNQHGCSLCGLEAKVMPCHDDGSFSVILNANHLGRGREFHVTGNGRNYGTYRYTDLPIELRELKADCRTEYQFTVYDTKQEHCGAVVEIGKVCCDSMNMPCPLDTLSAKAIKCNEGEKTIQVSIEIPHGKIKGFDIYDRNEFLGYFKTNDHGVITIEHFPISGHDYEYILICLNDFTNCCTEVEFKALECYTATETALYAAPVVQYEWIDATILISGQIQTPYQVQIINMEGKILLTKGPLSGDQSISIPNLPAGYYLVRIANRQGSWSYSFIKSS